MVKATDSEYDVVIIGAGISGINAAHRLQSQVPGCTYTILEARDVLGGTWALFKYPGIRSDSDLFTFGFSWKPWGGKTRFAGGEDIATYLQEAAGEQGIDKHIQYNHCVEKLSFSTDKAIWNLDVTHNGLKKNILTKFLIMGTGYYNYHSPLEVKIPGLDQFEGQVVHPQFWPEDLNWTDKKVVIIGSGATAITLLPNMAKQAKKVTMLQRSPGYVMTLPNQKKAMPWWVPGPIKFALDYLSYLILPFFFYTFCRSFPNAARKMIGKRTKALLPDTVPVDPHFNPKYNPWEQRLCMSPDGDFFECLRDGTADIATGTIKTMKGREIVLESGDTVEADMIITATGLKLQFAGGCKLFVDGKEKKISESYLWRGTLLQDVPNCAFIIGYTNASWTLGADCTALIVCRLLKLIEQKKARYVVASIRGYDDLHTESTLNLSSTYVTSNLDALPKSGHVGPWKARVNYFKDAWTARYGDLTTGVEFI